MVPWSSNVAGTTTVLNASAFATNPDDVTHLYTVVARVEVKHVREQVDIGRVYQGQTIIGIQICNDRIPYRVDPK